VGVLGIDVNLVSEGVKQVSGVQFGIRHNETLDTWQKTPYVCDKVSWRGAGSMV
jgi:hypothetical protein